MASNVFITTKQARHGVAETNGSGNLSTSAWLARLPQIALGYATRRWNRLDIEEAPNSVKRDLGFLDGCEPYREEDRMR